MPIETQCVMDSTLAWAGAASALVAGATGSLHCALMCGPLACATLPGPAPERRRAALAWHLGRIGAYTLVGLLLGAVGRGLTQVVTVSVQPVLPWVMAAGLVITALDLAKHLRPLPGVAQVSRALARAGAGLSPTARTLLLGAATPFLPCGLLYGLFLAAMATGSPGGGAVVLGAFSLGAVPALAAVQVGAQRLGRFGRAGGLLRRAVPLTAAAVLVVRAWLHRGDVTQCG